jgi:hypothetical protein
MKQKPILNWLYLANATILLTHQVDAAYWHEWEMFGLPGGVQFFLILNIPIALLVLYGQQAVALGKPSGKFFSWLLVVTGLVAFGVHAAFLAQGDAFFRLPVSMGLLLATLLLSLAQGWATVQWQRQSQPMALTP